MPTACSCSACATCSALICRPCSTAIHPSAACSRANPPFLPLLDLLNAADIAPLWGEDETIGWIYQYFNCRKSGKRMREAVRRAAQQPRTGGAQPVLHPALCGGVPGRQHVGAAVVQPDWRADGSASIAATISGPQAGRTARTGRRRLRDPRTIKLLDPACGSMHFGLYAFDVSETSIARPGRGSRRTGRAVCGRPMDGGAWPRTTLMKMPSCETCRG